MDKVETIEVKADFLKALNEEIINLKKQIAELKEDRDYYRTQMYFIIEQKEKLEREMDLTT